MFNITTILSHGHLGEGIGGIAVLSERSVGGTGARDTRSVFKSVLFCLFLLYTGVSLSLITSLFDFKSNFLE